MPDPTPERVGGPMSRSSDPETSHEAARAAGEHLTELQRRVLDTLRSDGPMSGRQMEQLERFADMSPSTVRKRLCELHAAKVIVADGVEKESGRTNCTVYRALELDHD